MKSCVIDIRSFTNEEEVFASMGENAKIKLNSVILHFRHDIYWPGWIYFEIESRRIFQNSQRLIRMDNTNRAQNRPTGEQLLQKSLYGDWNVVNEQISGTVPAFVRTGIHFSEG